MIPANLKVGDTYTDGGYTYKVTKVLDNPVYKYESTKVEKAVVAVDTVKEVEEEKKYTKTDINRMSGANLEKLCDELGLEKGTGTEMKKSLIKYFDL